MHAYNPKEHFYIMLLLLCSYDIFASHFCDLEVIAGIIKGLKDFCTVLTSDDRF
jgi:hypothetical protein